MLCSYCNEEKDVELFYRKKGIKHMCKKCNSNRMLKYGKNNPKYHEKQLEILKDGKKRRRNIRIEFINWLKSAPCTDCGKCFHPHVMDFDHIQPKKGRKNAVGCMVYRCVTEEEIFNEILKCQLVCSNCHRIRTIKRRVGLARYELEANLYL
jgi:hypothetical protein